MPYVFEAVTTLEGLHDLIAKYASTGKDASIIIKRIYASNSVRLDHRNGERMQNFYDGLSRAEILSIQVVLLNKGFSQTTNSPGD